MTDRKNRKTHAGRNKLNEILKKHTDLIIKIFCVLAAFLLWIYVMIVESPRDEYIIENVPVELINVDKLESGPAKLSVYSGYNQLVDVTISGKRSVVTKITPDDIKATADVENISRPTQTPIRIQVDVPEGCELISQSVMTVTVKTDNYIDNHIVDIYPNLCNKDPAYTYNESPEFLFKSNNDEDYTIVDSIIVKGPQSIVETITKAVVDIDLTDRHTEFNQMYPVYLVDSENTRIYNDFLDKNIDFVSVTMPVYITKSIPVNVSFRYGYLSETNSRISVTPPAVNVTCDPADADRADLLSSFYIDERKHLTEENINNHLFEITLPVRSPYDVKVGTNEVNVTVVIDNKINVRQMNITEIQSTNGINIDCNIFDECIYDVVICGTTEALASLRPSDLIAIVDLSSYTEEDITERTVQFVSIEIDSEYADELFVLGEYNVEIEITGKE